MKKKQLKKLILEDYGVINNSNQSAIEVCERLVLNHGIPYQQVEIIDDSLVNFHLVGASHNIKYFHICLDEKDIVNYGVEYIEGKRFYIDFYQSVNESIEYLDEFVKLCLSDDIFQEFKGKYFEY